MSEGWLFRVDSRPQSGSGHVSRCLALAREFVPFGRVRFVLDGDGSFWQERLRQATVEIELTSNADWLKGNWLGCIVDGYDFRPAEIAGWRSKTKFLVEFNDFGDPSGYADFVIGSQLKNWKAQSTAHVLSGLQYALLDPAYRDEVNFEVKPSVAHIVVCFGARDGTNAMEIALNALNSLLSDMDKVRVTAVLGATAPHRSQIEHIIGRYDSRFSLILDEKDMPGLLHTADFAIGAGGMCLLERMACGIPSVTIATADNQIDVIQMAAAAGGTFYAGPRADVGEHEMSAAVAGLLSNLQDRRKMSQNARKLVDGWGALRVAEAIKKHRSQLVALQA